MMMKIMIRLCFVFIGTFVLSGCSMFSPVQKGPEQGYVIDTIPHITSKLSKRPTTLLVLFPETNPAYDSKRIAFSLKPYQITYYTHNHWVGTPASMLQPLLVDTMIDTKRFKSVITPPYTGAYTYALRTQIQELKIDYTHKVPVLQMTLQAQLLSSSSSNLITSREFSAIVPMRASTPYAAVIAANKATSRILGKVAKWATSHA